MAVKAMQLSGQAAIWLDEYLRLHGNLKGLENTFTNSDALRLVDPDSSATMV